MGVGLVGCEWRSCGGYMLSGSVGRGNFCGASAAAVAPLLIAGDEGDQRAHIAGGSSVPDCGSDVSRIHIFLWYLLPVSDDHSFRNTPLIQVGLLPVSLGPLLHSHSRQYLGPQSLLTADFHAAGHSQRPNCNP